MSHYTLKCRDCNMTFTSPALLKKHKSKFCVGGTLGDPEELLMRRGLRSAEDFNQKAKSVSPEHRVSYAIIN